MFVFILLYPLLLVVQQSNKFHDSFKLCRSNNFDHYCRLFSSNILHVSIPNYHLRQQHPQFLVVTSTKSFMQLKYQHFQFLAAAAHQRLQLLQLRFVSLHVCRGLRQSLLVCLHWLKWYSIGWRYWLCRIRWFVKRLLLNQSSWHEWQVLHLLIQLSLQVLLCICLMLSS